MNFDLASLTSLPRFIFRWSWSVDCGQLPGVGQKGRRGACLNLPKGSCYWPHQEKGEPARKQQQNLINIVAF